MKAVKTSQVEFDVFKTLHVIENNKVLNEIFKDDNDALSYSMLRTMAKHNTLKVDMLSTLEEIFDRLIANNPSILKKYEKLDAEELKNDESKLPKHYGKVQILKDIDKNQTKIFCH